MFRVIAFVAVFLSSAMLFAHHGGSEYALNQTVEFKAKLTRVDLINPHSWLYFDVTDKDGKVSHHRCEMRSVHVLRRSGWTPDLFQVGQQMTLEASPNKMRKNIRRASNRLVPATRLDIGMETHSSSTQWDSCRAF